MILNMPRHSPGLGFADNGWGSVSVVQPVYYFILIVEPSPGSLRGLVKPLAIREGTPKLFVRRVTARGRDVISPLLNNFCTMEQNERFGVFFVMLLLLLMLLCFVIRLLLLPLSHTSRGVADGFERST